ncbi:hypothetical protein PIROE2DRAFT_14562, partial [Piromyces sp. E2]
CFSRVYGNYFYVSFESSEVYNSFYGRSIFYNEFFYDKIENSNAGYYAITSSIFDNIYGGYGSVVGVFNDNYNYQFYFTRCKFVNNYSKFGGVVYSININSPVNVRFEDCTFENNRSEFGLIAYSLSKETIPYFSNFDELIKNNNNNFITNPTKIIKDEISPDKLKILSGNYFKEDIIYKLYDDFNSQICFLSSINNMNNDNDIERIPIYTLEVNDTLNTKIIGSKLGYCYLDSCRISKVRIVGNPGVYTLTFKLLSFGNLLKFYNSTSSFEFEILPCPLNSSNKYYILQDIEKINLKSCYVPICDKPCNKGKCIGNNICNCNDTFLKGRYCNQYPKLKHIHVIDNAYITISLLLILLSFGLMYGIYFQKDNKFIKGGK